MVIKIFTKRKPGGEPIQTKSKWIDLMLEADSISTKREGDKVEVCIETKDDICFENVDLNTHGYQIYNNAGVVVEKFVTALKEGV
ncbi:hypothetical protein C8N47_11191 [Mangrovibacterium marinum]|uniref:Uncharacterized protein n=1 Tax=Mangrovibacterium marinum TaxID=1639118 RepID=A0A2T5C0E0_9BACT|nr:hypothetical protein [Mangrovibacterium marinum]PTN08051.1 hypothetical protein C8N47_11191 [Mangrovibacterium marinum]